MKAFVYKNYGSPEVLGVQQVDKPVPQSNEVLVKIHAVSLNPADWRMMRSRPFFIRFDTGFTKPKFGILGSDISGRVVAIGEDVTQFSIGDEVYGDIRVGGLADFAVTSEDSLMLKPENLSFDESAAVPKAANTALQAVRDFGKAQAGQSVLINGASGGIGTFALQIAKSLNLTLTGVSSTRNIELVRSLGADYTIDYTKSDFADGSHMYDLIIDLVGNRTVSDYKRALKPNGRALIVGFSTMSHMVWSLLKAMWVSKRSSQTIIPIDAKITQTYLSELKTMIESGALKPIIDRCYGFHQIPEAMSYLETGRARGKVVIRMNDQ